MRQVNIVWTPTEKQKEAFDILEDKTTNELLWGGGAGGGKSFLGCVWLILNCLRFPNSRWLMGRAILKSLKESTLLTFFEVCGKWGLIKDEDYHYNSQEGVITFIKTGSAVYLKDLFAYPSDPNFDSLGSTEYSGAFLDECSQITVKAFNIVKSRIRFRLDEFGIIPKILVCSNPCKNFLYYDFYKPYKNGTLPKYRKFLPALVQDNPFISHHYIENLKKLDKLSKERLLYGNWEYDEDESQLFEYDDIINMFKRARDSCGFGRSRFITADIARFGSDSTVIMVWRRLYVEKIYVYKKKSLKETRILIEEIARLHSVDIDKVIIDEDGVGGGIVDELGCKGFVNNSRPLERKIEQSNSNSPFTEAPKHNYSNLKSQCYFLLSKYLKEEKIAIYDAINEQVKELLIEDLEQIKQKDIDKDSKLSIIPKQEMKEMLGRSTDYSDALMMRMYFELKPEYIPYIAIAYRV